MVEYCVYYVEHPAGEEHGGPVADRQDHRPVLAALGLVDGDGVGRLQLPQHIGGIRIKITVCSKFKKFP